MTIARDPAVEAAARAWEEYPVPSDDADRYLREVPLAAAREALRPIRELHTKTVAPASGECGECWQEWPCDTAKLIYTTEELER